MQHQLGKTLIIIGGVIIIAGLILYFSDRLPFIGRMPGDIIMKKKNFTFYFPIATSIITSIILTLILYLVNRLR